MAYIQTFIPKISTESVNVGFIRYLKILTLHFH